MRDFPKERIYRSRRFLDMAKTGSVDSAVLAIAEAFRLANSQNETNMVRLPSKGEAKIGR